MRSHWTILNLWIQTGNNADTDDDNDGYSDVDEETYDSDPLNDSDSPENYSGILNFDLSDYSVDENAQFVVVKVIRSNGFFGAISVDYNLFDGSATASNDYEFASGTLSFADRETEKTIELVIIDDDLYEGDENFSVGLNNLSGTGATLGENSSTVINILENDDAPVSGVIGFEYNSEIVNESNGSLSVTVLRTEGTDGEVSVSFSSSDEAGIAGEDYDSLSGVLSFLDGESQKTIDITILNDDVYEPDETFALTLSNVTGGALLGTSNNQVSIIDDDPAPVAGVLQFKNTTYSISEEEASLEILVERINGDSGEVSVDVISFNGSASAGSDFEALNTNLIFADGETEKTITVNLFDDSDYEGDETFNLSLENIVGTEFGNNTQAAVSIVENDSPPEQGVLQLSGGSFEVSECIGSLQVTVTRSNGSDGVVSVDLATSDTTATADEDYQSVSQTVTLLDGEVSQVVTLVILDDTIYEGDERFNVQISNSAGGASIGDINTAEVIIVENDPIPPTGVLQFSANNYSVNESNGSFSITVIRAGGENGDIGVDYQFTDGTAQNGLEFNAMNGTLFFAGGEITKTISIDIIDDSVDEFNESFNISLISPTPEPLGSPNTAVINIVDDDTSSGGSTNSWILLLFLLFFMMRYESISKLRESGQ